ncbi:MAG: proline iminopeptidase [Gammaproteobacteria bacterium]|jgi:proline iminopeptidase
MNRRHFSSLLLFGACSFRPVLSMASEAAVSLPDTEFFPEAEESGFIAVKGGRVWYRLNGRKHFASGKTPLLVLHGGPGSSHHYLLPFLDLAKDRPVILYDQLDCGLADRPNDSLNWQTDRFVSEIDAIRNALGLDRVALFGNSCGATWAAEYAVRQPAGLKAMILGSPFLSGPLYLKDAKILLAALPADVVMTIKEHEAAGTIDEEEYHEAVFAWYQRHVCRVDPWPAFLNRTIELFNNDLYHHMWGPSEPTLNGTLKDYDLLSQLKKIKAPTFYLCGEHDEMTPETVSLFAKNTPAAKFKTYANASHTPHIEKRLEFMQDMREFLASSDARN